jgi:hypothetical protein
MAQINALLIQLFLSADICKTITAMREEGREYKDGSDATRLSYLGSTMIIKSQGY